MGKRGRQAISGLSRREKQVLALMAKGLENLEIGRRLGIAPHTMRSHTHRIYQKLGIEDVPGVNQRVLAILWYLER